MIILCREVARVPSLKSLSTAITIAVEGYVCVQSLAKEPSRCIIFCNDRYTYSVQIKSGTDVRSHSSVMTDTYQICSRATKQYHARCARKHINYTVTSYALASTAADPVLATLAAGGDRAGHACDARARRAAREAMGPECMRYRAHTVAARPSSLLAISVRT